MAPVASQPTLQRSIYYTVVMASQPTLYEIYIPILIVLWVDLVNMVIKFIPVVHQHSSIANSNRQEYWQLVISMAPGCLVVCLLCSVVEKSYALHYTLICSCGFYKKVDCIS